MKNGETESHATFTKNNLIDGMLVWVLPEWQFRGPPYERVKKCINV